MRKHFLFAVMNLFSVYSFSQIVVTEVMPNPASNGTINEFIEVFNSSFTDSVDLSTYSVTDNNTLSNFILQSGKKKIAPRRFAVLLDSDYFNAANSLLRDYVSLIPDTVSLFKTSNSSIGNSLGNTSDSVKIFTQLAGTGILVSSFAWTSTVAGKSWEKKNSDGSAFDKTPSLNWSLSLSAKGTPGFTNSVSPLDYDAALTQFLVFNSNVSITDSVSFSARIKNNGTQKLNSVLFSVFADTSKNGIYEGSEKFFETTLSVLNSIDSVTIAQKFLPNKTGTFRVAAFVKVINDQQKSNDSSSVMITVNPVVLKDVAVLTFSVLPKVIGEKKDSATFSVLLKNQGTENSGLFQFDLFNGATSIYQKTVSNLSVGDILWINSKHVFQSAGTFSITAKVNLNGDENKSNDTISTIITVAKFNNKNAVVLSEIMFNASGTESQNEFVEIYNSSETDSVDLRGFKIKDASSTVSTLISRNGGFILKPKQFAVIHPPSYYLQPVPYYQQEDTVTSLRLTLSTSSFGNGLTNSGETIYLISNTGDTLEAYFHAEDYGDGYSAEKINLEVKNDNLNWAKSISFNGSSGSVNENNLFDINASLSSNGSVAVYPGQNPSVTVTLTNLGKKGIPSAKLVVYEDKNLDNIPDSQDSISVKLLSNLDLLPGNSVTETLTASIIYTEPLNWIIFLRVTGDAVLNNNKTSVRLNIANQRNTVQISEIMYNPINDKTDGLSNQPEYVELYNPGNHKIFLNDWVIGDRVDEDGSSNKLKITDSVYIYPHSYFVISSDSNLVTFWTYFNPTDTSVQYTLLNKSGLNLNADGDAVIIYDLYDAVIDSVFYSDKWHNPEYSSTKGISLERRSFSASPNDPYNWGSSSSRPTGGTPGKTNSIHISGEGNSASNAEFSPNPFSPDNDGFEDVCNISYSLKGNVIFVQARIFDRLGRQVRTLQNYSPAGPAGTFIWDGKRDDGSFVLMGPYIVFIEGMNSANGVVEAVKKVVVVAKKL